MTTQLLTIKSATLLQRLAHIAANHASPVFATSLSAEDMVITDLIVKNKLNIAHITLNTGRLHDETLALLVAIPAHYAALGHNLEITAYTPEPAAVQTYVVQWGENGFYDSLAARKACCNMRKVQPLNAALAGHDAWITGQRREQSETRTELAFEEIDPARSTEKVIVKKYNPLFDWTNAEVWAYIHAHAVPYNALHARGYPSIGCEPCTRAIRPGEDARAGRWWWEQRDNAECGLHK